MGPAPDKDCSLGHQSNKLGACKKSEAQGSCQQVKNTSNLQAAYGDQCKMLPAPLHPLEKWLCVSVWCGAAAYTCYSVYQLSLGKCS